MILDIPHAILEYTSFTYKNYVPLQRYNGFDEIEGQKRGQGDFIELATKLTLFDHICKQNKICGLELVSGTGDDKDLFIQVGGRKITWNIKTSNFAPFRSGLNLFIKREELEKEVSGYIQAFVHLEEENTHPHIHVVGFVLKGSDVWNEYNQIVDIPRTNHRGVKIPVEKLHCFETLVRNTDRKF